MTPRTLEFLVFSPHKSATQTVAGSLRAAGFAASPCHALNIGKAPVGPGELAAFAADAAPGVGPLRIVSVWRDPVDRLVSSMFQWHGTGVVRLGMVPSIEETIIHTLPVDALRRHFVEEYVALCENDESLPLICDELSLDPAALKHDPAAGPARLTGPGWELHLLRFDRFVAEGDALLSAIAGRDVAVRRENIAANKWYAPKYAAFRDGLRLPADTVRAIHAPRRALIEAFHPEGYDAVLERALARFA